MNRGFNIRLRISYIVLGLVFVLVGGFFIFYFLYYERKITIEMIDIMSYAAGSIGILTLIYYSLNLESIHYFHSQNLKIRINQYSFEVISKVYEFKMAETLAVLKLLKSEQAENLKEKNIKDFTKYLDENVDIRTKLSLLLNYFEHISLLVEKEHVDEKIIKSAFKTMFTSSYSLLKFFIDEKQSTHRTTWIKFENLAKKWSVEG